MLFLFAGDQSPGFIKGLKCNNQVEYVVLLSIEDSMEAGSIAVQIEVHLPHELPSHRIVLQHLVHVVRLQHGVIRSNLHVLPQLLKLEVEQVF